MAETWILIDEEYCSEKFAEGEWEAFTTSALASGLTDVVTACIRRIVNRVRGYVAACEKNLPLGPAGTVPPELEDACMELIREDLATRLPGSGVVIDEPRREKIKQANRDLQAVSRCEIIVTPPEVPADAQQPADTGAYGGEPVIDWTQLR